MLNTARIAGILAAKRCGELIPLCHPLPIESVTVDFELKRDRILITSTARITAKTGVEMEALTAVSVAALAIYDMCKAIDKKMVIEGIHLIDDPDEAPKGYDRETIWDGLGLIDHAIVPHYRSPHPETAAAERAVRHLCSRGLRYRALRDGEVIVWTENRMASVDLTRRIA